MSIPPQHQVLALVGQMSAVLKSLHEFDNQELLPVVKKISSPTDRQKCFIACYYRVLANVRTALGLNHPSHFQAIAMIARANLEIAMDVILLDHVLQGVEKMLAFGDSEKLKTAKKIVEFAKKSGESMSDLAIYEKFIAGNEATVIAQRKQLWGFPQPPEHWSSLKIKDRAAKLGPPFDELYEIKFRHLSWQVHAGLTGVLGLESVAFVAICGDALAIVIKCYEQVLRAMISELKLAQHDPKVLKKLEYARLVPLTSSPGEAAQLQHELLT